MSDNEIELVVGPVAHGGHCVARDDGQVVFVRHALPGERVLAVVTEGGAGDRFVRADAIEVIEASPERVEPPCPYAVPGGCGGCDWQHAALPAQRRLKAAVVEEQLRRLARLEREVSVEPLPGDEDGLGWRTRVDYAVDAHGRAGLRRHRSHDVVPVERCRIAAPGVARASVLEQDWTGERSVDVVAPSLGPAVVMPVPSGLERSPAVTERVVAGGLRHDFEVPARGFWQVHPGAAATFVEVALSMLAPRGGERALDLYAGVGLFAAALAGAVGPGGQVVAVESDSTAVEAATRNLAPWRNALVVPGRVDDLLGVARRPPKGRRHPSRRGRTPARSPLLPATCDLVLLDPPRTGAGRGVLEAVVAMSPRVVVYVACDPAALARDTAYLSDIGYRLNDLRAFDAFPMTHHVECLARFVPTQG